jgi:hypothetical protein
MYGVRLTRFLITILCAFAFYQIGASLDEGITRLSSRSSYMVGIIITSLFYEIQSARAAKGALAKGLLGIDRWFQQVYSRSMWLRVIARGLCFLLLYHGLQQPWVSTAFTSPYLLKRLVVDSVVVLFFGLMMEFLLPKAEQS